MQPARAVMNTRFFPYVFVPRRVFCVVPFVFISLVFPYPLPGRHGPKSLGCVQQKSGSCLQAGTGPGKFVALVNPSFTFRDTLLMSTRIELFTGIINLLANSSTDFLNRQATWLERLSAGRKNAPVYYEHIR
jgi:hypothetical protein